MFSHPELGSDLPIRSDRELGCDSTGDPEATYLWLDRVSEIYAAMGCSNEQKVLFSRFVMAARVKDWWEAIKRRYPIGVTWD